MNYKICFTPEAEKDLLNAKYFYSKTNLALGQYCVDSLMLDIGRLQFFAGIHPQFGHRYRMLARKLPYSIYYQIFDKQVLILAVLDNRQNPKLLG